MTRIILTIAAILTFAPLSPPAVAQDFFLYPQTAVPIVNPDFSIARPIGVGSVAVGGPALSIQVSTVAFASPVDITFGLLAPAITPELFLLAPNNVLHPASLGTVFWQSNVVGSVNQAVLGDIPAVALPPGTYQLFLTVFQTQNPAISTMWTTSFTITPAGALASENIRVEANVEAVDPLRNTITFQGLPGLIVFARFGMTDFRGAALGSISPGNNLRIRGDLSVAGGAPQIVATRLELISPAPDPRTILRGTISGFDANAGIVNILGIAVDTNTILEGNLIAANGGIGRAAFFGALRIGALVTARIENGIWDQIAIQ